MHADTYPSKRMGFSSARAAYTAAVCAAGPEPMMHTLVDSFSDPMAVLKLRNLSLDAPETETQDAVNDCNAAEEFWWRNFVFNFATLAAARAIDMHESEQMN